MKKILVLLTFGAFITVTGCKKNSDCNFSEVNTTASSSEIAYIQSYLTSTGVTNAVQHSSGVFFILNIDGNGSRPTSLCNIVNMNYAVFKFGSASPFDSNSSSEGVSFYLGNIIVGLQKLLPSVKAGSNITAYIPPSLAYGNQDVRDANGTVILPANSYIKFDINLKAVQ